MKESVGSLRLFFLVLAALWVWNSGLYLVLSGGQNLASFLGTSAWDMLIGILSIILVLGFLYFAVALPKYLNPARVRYPKWTVGLMVLLVLINLVSALTAVSDTSLIIGAVIWAAIDLFIAWIIYKNLKRLSS